MSGHSTNQRTDTSERPWQDSLQSMGAALNFLLTSGTHSDITFVVGDEGMQFRVSGFT